VLALGGMGDVARIHYPSCTYSIKPSQQFSCNFVVINASEGSFCFQIFNFNKNFNINSKSKEEHNSVKMLVRVTSCLPVGVMMVKRYAKFQSHMSMEFENI
jgi:hypothetical protein